MNRHKQIDVLRTLAVLLVLGRHLLPCPPESHAIFCGIAGVWSRGGWIGVDIFFVLSGFLVSGLLFREYEKYNSLNIARFLIRRGFKIYPPFWLLIGVTVLVAALKPVMHFGLSIHKPLEISTYSEELNASLT